MNLLPFEFDQSALKMYKQHRIKNLVCNACPNNISLTNHSTPLHIRNQDSGIRNRLFLKSNIIIDNRYTSGNNIRKTCLSTALNFQRQIINQLLMMKGPLRQRPLSCVSYGDKMQINFLSGNWEGTCYRMNIMLNKCRWTKERTTKKQANKKLIITEHLTPDQKFAKPTTFAPPATPTTVRMTSPGNFSQWREGRLHDDPRLQWRDQ